MWLVAFLVIVLVAAVVPFLIAGRVATRINRESGRWAAVGAFIFVLAGLFVAESILLMGACEEFFVDISGFNM